MSNSDNARKAIAYINLVLAEDRRLWDQDKLALAKALTVLEGLTR